MATVRDLIKGSLRLIGASDPQESLDAAIAEDALAALNAMVAAWNLEHLALFKEIRETFTLSASTQTYTMGSGATFNTDRPVRIYRASVMSGDDELYVNLVDQATWASIPDKTATSTLPTTAYSDGNYPNTTISVWPIPSSSGTLVLYSWSQLAALADLDTVLSFPPGYERALRYNLAVELAPEYGMDVPQAVAVTAARALGALKRVNTKPYYLRCDEAVLSRGRRGAFDPKTETW